MYAGKQFLMETQGLEHYNHLCEQESGFVVLSSHIGNFEMAGYTQVSDKKSVNALVYFGEKASVMENRGKMFGPNGNKMIQVRDDMSHLFEIDNALTHGEVVSIPADRVWGSQKSILLPFLGHEARFPLGPFSVATMRGLDVVCVNVMKTSTRGYLIIVTPLDYDKEAPRREQTRATGRGLRVSAGRDGSGAIPPHNGITILIFGYDRQQISPLYRGTTESHRHP